MSRIVAVLAVGAALTASPGAALAASGNSSSWGSEGYGPRVPTQSLSTFDRRWNHQNEALDRAEQGADWLRLHGRSFAPPR